MLFAVTLVAVERLQQLQWPLIMPRKQLELAAVIESEESSAKMDDESKDNNAAYESRQCSVCCCFLGCSSSGCSGSANSYSMSMDVRTSSLPLSQSPPLPSSNENLKSVDWSECLPSLLPALLTCNTGDKGRKKNRPPILFNQLSCPFLRPPLLSPQTSWKKMSIPH